jgi:serine/threonine protein kinase
MEYVEGVSLEKVLQTERLPPARTAGLMVEIADAVHYAHRRGFVHRDLKPANVLLDKEGRAHVVDFGLAVHESVQRRRAGQYAGTPPYMAPEQVRGETHRLDGRADVWALGVMLYEMLSGGHPFAGENWEDLADEIQNREPKPPRQTSDGDQIPAELERICLRCLCKPVAGRYNTAGDVSRDLRRWLHPRPRFRRPAFVGGLAAAVLLLALGARQLWQRVHEPLPAAAPALSGTIDVLIWNPTDRSRRFLKLHDRGALPLRPNDQIRVEARLNRPAYLYLVWIDSEGRAFPVYPWQPGQWSRRLPKQAPASRLSLPETADQGWPMKGPAGMETLMLLARESPLPADVDLAGLLAGLPKVPLQDPRALVCFADGQMVTRLQDADRGPNFFGAQQIDDPVLKTQRELRDRLGSHFELNRAVTFANQGE